MNPWAELNDATVNQARRRGLTDEQIIEILVRQKEDMIKRMIELESLCPKKIRTPQGVMVWHCPTELIPFS